MCMECIGIVNNNTGKIPASVTASNGWKAKAVHGEGLVDL